MTLPLEQTAMPRWPVARASGPIQRDGRAVHSTTGIPSASTRAIASRVRASIVPSLRRSVPSRSVATSRGITAGSCQTSGDRQ